MKANAVIIYAVFLVCLFLVGWACEEAGRKRGMVEGAELAEMKYKARNENIRKMLAEGRIDAVKSLVDTN